MLMSWSKTSFKGHQKEKKRIFPQRKVSKHSDKRGSMKIHILLYSKYVKKRRAKHFQGQTGEKKGISHENRLP